MNPTEDEEEEEEEEGEEGEEEEDEEEVRQINVGRVLAQYCPCPSPHRDRRLSTPYSPA